MRWLAVLMILAGLAACSNTPRPAEAPSPSKEQQIRALLYAQHEAWRGVPYRLGGLSRRGIDCSGFVYLTYRDVLGVQIPRHTAVQATAGPEVPQAELQTGDLVFFRTGNSRHVGIVVEERSFLHASTSSGVMISSLDDAYWARRFWRAVRIPGH